MLFALCAMLAPWNLKNIPLGRHAFNFSLLTLHFSPFTLFP